MVFSKKLSRRKKGFLIFSVVLLCGILASYFIIVYKFKEVLKVIIAKESKGRYRFNASDIDFSIWNKKITVRNASINAIDTVNSPAHYDISIRKIYLSIESLNDVLFKDRMVVYDVLIDHPVVKAHIHTKDNTRRSVSYQASDVFEVINNISSHLQVRNFKVLEGAVSYSSIENELPFKADHINLAISNFKKKDSASGNLLYTDDVELSIADQSWTLPGGRQEITFKNFHFSGRNQFVQVDTCTLLVKGDEGEDEISLFAHKLRFTPRQLLNHFKHGELLIDSLVCVRPLLVLHKKNKDKKNKAGSISDAVHQMFNNVNLKHVQIIKGAFEIYEANNSRPSYATELADIEIFNIAATNLPSRDLNVDSVKLKLNNLNFITKDSLYQLNVAEFSLKNNDLTFVNASFGNAPGNPNPSNLTFSTPSLRFRKIDLEELMMKKLKAPAIEIYRPTINLFAKSKDRTSTDTTVKFSAKDFYKVIHGVAEIINVDSFRIVNGNLYLRSAGNKVRADLESINGIVLINDFLESDSLVDVKRAIPDMNIEAVSVGTPGVALTANRFHFNGGLRVSKINNFQVAFPNGNKFSGKNLSMELLDWDVFQKTKDVQIKRMSIGEVVTELKDPENSNLAKSRTEKPNDLPIIRVGRLDIGKLGFAMDRKTSAMKMNADNVSIENVSTHHQFVVWNNLRAGINNFSYKGVGFETAFKSLKLENKNEGIVKEASVGVSTAANNIRFNTPELKIVFDLNSTDFSKLTIRSLGSDGAALAITSAGNEQQVKEKNTKVTTPARTPDETTMPDNGTTISTTPANGTIIKQTSANKINTPAKSLNLAVMDIALINTKVSYNNNNDSIDAQGLFDFSANKINLSKGLKTLATFGAVSLAAKDVIVKNHETQLSLPRLKLDLSAGEMQSESGNRIMLHSSVDLQWKNLKTVVNTGDDAVLEVEGLSGTYQNKNFSYETGESLPWWQMSRHLTLSGGKANYKNSRLTAGLQSITWNGPTNTFTTGPFFVTPKLTLEETQKHATWQKDYLQFEGNSSEFKGINYSHRSGDSLLSVNRLTFDKVNLVTTRDKRLPFKHGTEKSMPTALINSIKLPVNIDSIIITGSNVTIREISKQTNKTGVIPLEHVNATITNLTNRPGSGEALQIMMSAKLLDNFIDHFEYREKYMDPLSPFELKFNASTMKLQDFSKATAPLANINVTNGRSDTLYAHWVGNKYAAIGVMNFYYKGLRISLIDKIHPEKKQLKSRITNFLVNTILKNSNKRQTVVFFERDPEKFVFNYWVKTTLSGLMTSVGIKRNRKMLKQYNKVRVKYSLPAL
ncbi:MAG TPA: hypothetical protein VK616_08120 [Flavitalea sp.]|nr:hypothetical protein [Flavitalea sp.]